MNETFPNGIDVKDLPKKDPLKSYNGKWEILIFLKEHKRPSTSKEKFTNEGRANQEIERMRAVGVEDQHGIHYEPNKIRLLLPMPIGKT